MIVLEMADHRFDGGATARISRRMALVTRRI
jgi:hypothetical protein